MSEYQYYEFQAIDRPLSRADQEALRAMSTRARITATSFTNSYEWGDFKGDPAKLMENWFDLHLYLANWGSRRLMIRWPSRQVDQRLLSPLLRMVDCAELRRVGESLILDIAVDEVQCEEWDDGSGWLAALTPLRGDVLRGDTRLFYLLWLTEVSAGTFGRDEPEPMPGIGPITGALEAFAEFFQIDSDLIAAAAECMADPLERQPPSAAAVEEAIAGLTEREKADLLVQLFADEALAAAQLRSLVVQGLAPSGGAPPAAVRTVGQLVARAEEIRDARKRARAEKAAADRRRRDEEVERLYRAQLDDVRGRGERVWQAVEAEIDRRCAVGYDVAAALLRDLRVISQEDGWPEEFSRRLHDLRDRHVRKERFIERLAKLG